MKRVVVPSQIHRLVGFGRNLKVHLIPTPCQGQVHLPLDQVVLSPVQPVFLQGVLPTHHPASLVPLSATHTHPCSEAAQGTPGSGYLPQCGPSCGNHDQG